MNVLHSLNRWWRSSLLNKLLAAHLATMLFFLGGLGYLLYFAGLSGLQGEVATRNAQLSRLTAEQVEEQLANIYGNLHLFTFYPGVLGAMLPLQAQAMLELRLAYPLTYRALYLFDADGQQLLHLEEPLEELLLVQDTRAITDRPPIPLTDEILNARQAAQRQEMFISSPYVVGADQVPVLYMGMPVVPKQSQAGLIVVAEIDLRDIWRIVDEVRIGETGCAFVVSGQGIIIAHPQRAYIGQPIPPELRPVLGGFAGQVEYVDPLSERPMLAAYDPVGGQSDWGIVVEQNRDEAFASMQSFNLLILRAMLVALVLAAAVTILVGLTITRPIQSLAAVTRRIADTGDLGHDITPHGQDEVGRLAAAFNQMIASLRQAGQSLRASEEQVRRQNRDLLLLNRVIATCGADQSLETTLEVVCSELAQAFQVVRVVVADLEEDRTLAIVQGEYRPKDHLPALGRVVPIAHDPALVSLLDAARGAPVFAEDVSTTSFGDLMSGMERLDGAQLPLLALPLLVEGEAIGILAMIYDRPRPFPAEEINLIQRVAEQLSAYLARAHLSETQRRLSTAVEQSAEGIYITDTAGTILYVNPAFERITGYSRAEVVGRDARILRSSQHDPAFYRRMWQSLAAGEIWQGRLVSQRKDGSLYTAEATIAPVRDQAGEIVNFVASHRDVTREMELEEQFHQAQKMDALGRLAGGVAHDFNNLLTVIQMSNQLLEQQTVPQDPLWEHVRRIRQAGERATELTRQLLSFSRRSAVEPRVLDLNQVITNLLKMLQRIIGEHIELKTALAMDLWPVTIDPAQVDQVIMNLVVNSHDAMPRGGVLTIKTANGVLDEAYTARHVDAQPGEYVVLTIGDTGVGMDDTVKAHLFEPFFTTKSPGQGTGLGLATVFGIVKQSGGHIQVDSEPGHGATVSIYLPRAAVAAAPPPAPVAPGDIKRGSETILVVEDAADVRDMVVRVLQMLGYRVLAAEDGAQALEVAAGHSGTIDLLLTDVVMQRMGGRQLAEALCSGRPDMRVLLMSGYSDGAPDQQDMVEDDGIAFIAKPFTVDRLTRIIRAVLDREV